MLVIPSALATLLVGTVVGLGLHARSLRKRLDRSEADLAKSEAGWSQAMDFLEDPMYLVDLDDRLVRANRAFYKQIGKGPEEAVGRDVRTLIHLKPEETPCPACAARLEKRDAFFTKEVDDPTNPTGRPIEVTIRVIRDSTGAPIGVLQGLRDLSHLRATEDALRKSEVMLKEAQRIANMGSWDWNVKSGELYWSEETYRIFGRDPENFATSYDTFFSTIHPDDVPLMQNVVREALEKGVAISVDHRIVLPDGSERIVYEQGQFFFDKEGKPERMAGVVQDITERKRAEAALFAEKERAQVTLQSIGDAVITTDEHGVVDYLNPTASALIGDARTGCHYRQLIRLIDEDTRQPIHDPVAACLAENGVVLHEGHALLVRADGGEAAVDVTVAPMRDSDGCVCGVVLALHDVTEMRGMARQLNYQATHDPLTGLINRREFEIRLQYALESARIDDKQHALIYMDLDQFKVVNDTCGHIAGDELLKQVAVVLGKKLRNGDTLARLGGDEFAVLLQACPTDIAQRIAEELRREVKEFRFAWEDKLFEIGVSIGLVPVSADSGSRMDVLSAADAACYMAKDTGRNRLYVYAPDDSALHKHQGEMQWVHRITQALDQDRFTLYSQTIRSLGNQPGRAHFEILVRMLDQDGNIVPPNAFIPAAERYQLMPAIDRWVIRNTFAAMREARGLQAKLAFAINLSGQSLSESDFLDFIVQQLEESGVSTKSICFEVTETAAIANLTSATRFIGVLRSMGVRFALDDFGSGLSSFAYLKNLPVDYLKIDGSFVKDIADDAVDYAMVSAINQIGHLMGIATIAEFVESQAILDKLEELGVDYAQGYHLGKPQPLMNVLSDETRRNAS